MLGTEASKRLIGRQVFWLTARYGPQTAFPRLGDWATFAVASLFAGLADHSGGPATELHRFPYSPPLGEARGTCRYSEVGVAMRMKLATR